MMHTHSTLWPGVPLALGSALLFGASAPLSKLLLTTTDPQMLAGLLYLGAGIGLAIVHLVRSGIGLSANEAPLGRKDMPWLAAIVVFGGIIGPLLLMLGLSRTTAASGSLLLNLESVATMGIAWLFFRESVDRRLLLGAFAIVLGAAALSWHGQGVSLDIGAVLVAAACVSWGIDNNLTRKLSSSDPVLIALTKGLAAGSVNIGIALARGAEFPVIGGAFAAAVVGFVSVGLSLVLFVRALRYLGTARTGAYFSLAPFVGAMISVLLFGDSITVQFVLAFGLMAFGLWVHLTEDHVHAHEHPAMDHDHSHIHDEHHQHRHEGPIEEPHSHPHHHAPMRHKHPHYPDLHHRHEHAG